MPCLDGFKDYAEVETKVKPYKFISMSPNPTTNNISLQYIIEDATTAYFSIISLTDGSSNNYIINPSSSQKSINMIN